ncbi:polyprenyl diphosphate synthase [Streptomyces sp. AA4]|uniref:polyprenyl diphosphate synthase n=1 Tax=Streptomyces sp. AA4 TaxID=591158 RepID=UPI002570B79B|nr:polyprenyl diphosphate synthase [Streptomyces sp. AA4]
MSLRSFMSDVVYSIYSRRLIQQSAGRHPRHIAIMLDGNRRWAREAGFTDVADGHRAGAKKIADFLSWCQEADVEVVTMWLLSTDNLNRDPDELTPLLKIITDVTDELAGAEAPWRLRIVGALDLLPLEVAQKLTAAAARTENHSGMEVNIAVGYGGRQEIADAVRKLLLQHADEGTSIRELAKILDVDHISEHLYTSGQPDPDLIIRTSGEQRLSGFLLTFGDAYATFIEGGGAAGYGLASLAAGAYTGIALTPALVAHSMEHHHG